MKFEKIPGKQEGVIIFIHGNSSSPKVFESIIRNTSLPYTLVNIELLGHGSSAQQTYNDSQLNLVNCLDNLTHIVNSFKEKTLLVGHGLGGHLAIGISPEISHLTGMLLTGVPPFKKPVNIAEAFMPLEFLECYFKADYCEKEIQTTLPKLSLYRLNQHLISEDFKRTLPQVRKTIANNLFQNRWANEYDIVLDSQFPIYFVQGDKDPVVSKSYLKHLAAQSPKYCKFIEVANSSHYVMLDAPKAFEQTLIQLAKNSFST